MKTLIIIGIVAGIFGSLATVYLVWNTNKEPPVRSAGIDVKGGKGNVISGNVIYGAENGILLEDTDNVEIRNNNLGTKE